MGDAPRRIARYVVERRLGAGGMGVVFLADDTELKRKVVVKLLRPDVAGTSPADHARLLREAQAMAQVSHANVVQIYDVGVHDDQVFLVMQLIDGQDLAAWLATPRATRDVIDVFVAAGRGLAAAHRAGLVHRDFKPHNVMIGNGGEVKVTDFGLARSDGAVAPGDPGTLLDSPLTASGAMVGTPAYMAPEQMQGEPVDARTDQFSFCVAFHEGLYGKRPFTGSTLEELYDSIVDGALPVPKARGIPARVRTALRRGLSAKPADRFPSMDALLDAIAPRAKTRYAIAAAAAVALAGAGIAAARWPTATRLCTGARDEIASVWNAQRRAAITAAFTAVDTGFGPRAATAVATIVDRYTDAWARVHEDACAATRVRGEQPEQAMEQRMACLRRRRFELDAKLDLFAAHPDASTLADAPGELGNLIAPESCNNLAAADPWIGDPKLRATVEPLQRELAIITELVEHERSDEAAARLTKLRPAVERASYPPLAAELAYQEGILEEKRLRYREAGAAFDRAIELAEKTSIDRVRAAAQIQQISIARALDDLAGADRWARQAAATLARLGDTASIIDLHRGMAEVARARGNPGEAAKLLRDAIGRSGGKTVAATRRVAVLRQDLAGLLIDTGDFEAAYAEAAAARQVFVEIGVPDNPDAALATGTLATIRFRQGRGAEAAELGQQNIAMLERYFGREHRVLAAPLSLQAVYLQRAGKLDEAEALIKRSVSISERAHGAQSVQLADTLLMLGGFYLQRARYDDAYAALERALAAYTAAKGAESQDVTIALNTMAGVRRRQERYDDALALLERSRAILQKLAPDGAQMANVLTRIATVERMRGRAVAAIPLVERALAMANAAKAGPAEVAWMKLELAKAVVGRDRRRAIALAKEAAALASSAGDQATVDDATTWLAEKR